MNFITYEAAVSLFPYPTLIRNMSYLLPMTPRGWQAAAASPVIPRDSWTDKQITLTVHRHPLYTSSQERELGMNTTRRMGDRWSWSVFFDGNGCVTEGETSETNHENDRRLGNTGWIMKYNRTVPILHLSNVDPGCFGPYTR